MPALIGNRAHAAEAVENYNALLDGFDSATGEWSCIGSGCFREAWLHMASDVVYKIEIDDSEPDYGNRAEWRNARALRRMLWENVYIPLTSLYVLPSGAEVIAMEHIDGTLGKSQGSNSYYSKGYLELSRKAGFSDMHGANFKINSKGKIVPIDMASERWPTE